MSTKKSVKIGYVHEERFIVNVYTLEFSREMWYVKLPKPQVSGGEIVVIDHNVPLKL